MNVNQYLAERDHQDRGKHSLLGAQHSLSQPNFVGGAPHSGRQGNDVNNVNNNNILVLNTESASAEDASVIQPSIEDAPTYQ